MPQWVKCTRKLVRTTDEESGTIYVNLDHVSKISECTLKNGYKFTALVIFSGGNRQQIQVEESAEEILGQIGSANADRT